MYIRLMKRNTKQSITSTNLKILGVVILSMIEEENEIPPTKERTIEAKIPNIVMYSLYIPLNSFSRVNFVSSMLSARILLTFST